MDEDKRYYYLGIISGFIFGVLSPIIFTIGIFVSVGIQFIYPLLFPVKFLFILINKQWLGGLFLFLTTLFLNGIFFSFIGYVIQKFLRKRNKNEKIILYIFITVIISAILLMIIESLFGYLFNQKV